MFVVRLVEPYREFDLPDVESLQDEHVRLVTDILEAPSVVGLLENVWLFDAYPLAHSPRLLEGPLELQPFQTTKGVAQLIISN